MCARVYAHKHTHTHIVHCTSKCTHKLAQEDDNGGEVREGSKKRERRARRPWSDQEGEAAAASARQRQWWRCVGGGGVNRAQSMRKSVVERSGHVPTLPALCKYTLSGWQAVWWFFFITCSCARKAYMHTHTHTHTKSRVHTSVGFMYGYMYDYRLYKCVQAFVVCVCGLASRQLRAARVPCVCVWRRHRKTFACWSPPSPRRMECSFMYTRTSTIYSIQYT